MREVMCHQCNCGALWGFYLLYVEAFGTRAVAAAVREMKFGFDLFLEGVEGKKKFGQNQLHEWRNGM